DRIGADRASYPYEIELMRFFAPAPADGEVRVEARFEGFADEAGRHPRVRLQAIDQRHDRVCCDLVLVEVLMPKGPIGSAPTADRLAFLRDRRFVPGLALSKVGPTTVPDPDAIRASDWLPGTVATVYASPDARPQDIAAKDHVAALAHVHPSTVTLVEGGAVCAAQPLTRWPLEVTAEAVRSTGEPTLDLTPVTTFWDQWFSVGHWPVEDLYYGLARRFVRRFHLEDPAVMAAMSGRSMLYLGNHQVGVESLMFSVLMSGIQQVSTVTLAKAEHRTTWLGQLIQHCFAWPGVTDPEVITFFDRDDKASLPAIIGRLATQMAGPGKSVMVHVEGTRSLECRSPVEKMSGAFIDMAIHVDAPVVPIRFVGALPVEPLTERLEFPVGMGVQDVWIGTPIPAAELAAVPYKERKERVVGAMNTIGPPKGEEVPFDGDPAFAAKVAERVARTGVDEPHAVLLEVLAETEGAHADSLRIVEGDRTGELRIGSDPKERWLGELARRMYGPNGARVVG
ncbi:MAG: 1-acyl-sn-glycerol-3-phosphate acyltransferase, partial [Alphaproteobacteria bacterium]|nr:1-acyl-sn-glycerol-3-phosphate acyltransferase [Alphaproteobacteria bacterium]